jgi:hypothetical protein
MWEPRRLTTLWASKACYRNSFNFFYLWNSRYLFLCVWGLLSSGNRGMVTRFQWHLYICWRDPALQDGTNPMKTMDSVRSNSLALQMRGRENTNVTNLWPRQLSKYTTKHGWAVVITKLSRDNSKQQCDFCRRELFLRSTFVTGIEYGLTDAYSRHILQLT